MRSSRDTEFNACAHETSFEKKAPQNFIVEANTQSKIKKVIAVVSGKGGVGKSLTTGLSAVTANRIGYRTAILDADITGPSIPKMFGITEKAYGDEKTIFPAETKTGIKLMSLNLLVENETDPVVWRGTIVSNIVKQFWTDVVWGEIDFMFIDMPPGTSDVPLTVYQSLPIDGIIIVTSPQDLVEMIVEKAANMAKMMNIPLLGIVENMSYLQCPHCNEKIEVFGKSQLQDLANRLETPILGKIPISQELATACDQGKIELFTGDWLTQLEKLLEKLYKQCQGN